MLIRRYHVEDAILGNCFDVDESAERAEWVWTPNFNESSRWWMFASIHLLIWNRPYLFSRYDHCLRY